jgi:hypothetical protein
MSERDDKPGPSDGSQPPAEGTPIRVDEGDRQGQPLPESGMAAERECSLRWQIIEDGDPGAVDELAAGHKHLVEAIARNFQGKGLPLKALHEAGMEGLLEAVEQFDPTEGARFSTVASWWIKHAMREALMEARGAPSAREDAGALGSWGRDRVARPSRLVSTIACARREQVTGRRGERGRS